MAIIKEEGGDYGLQKVFGTAGAVAFGPVAGKLVDVASSGGGGGSREDYSLVVWLYFFLRCEKWEGWMIEILLNFLLFLEALQLAV